MKATISILLQRWPFLVAAFCVAAMDVHAGMNITIPTNNVVGATITISYGLGTPLPDKTAYIFVQEPSGSPKLLDSAVNIPDHSKTIYYTPTVPGNYTFYYEYTYPEGGVTSLSIVQTQSYTLYLNQVTFSNITSPTYATPGSTVSILATITNSGQTTWDSTYYIQLSDYGLTHIGYLNFAGLAPGASSSISFNVTLPAATAPGTYTYHLCGVQNNVEYFASYLDVPIIVDYKPTTTFSITPTSVTTGQSVTASCTTSAPQFQNVINEAIDYYAPTASDWTSGTEAAGSRWDGSNTNSKDLSFTLTIPAAGTWRFRARGQDDQGQLSEFQNISVSASAPVAAPVLSTPSITSGTVGQTFSCQLVATNSPTSYAANGLPSGLSINTSTGLISGTPTVAGTFTVIASASNSSGNSLLTFTLNISAGSSGSSLSILSQPLSQVVLVGSSVTLSVSASSSSSLSYQWLKNGTNISGAISASYIITSAQTADSGAYSVLVTAGSSSLQSTSATLTVLNSFTTDTNNDAKLNVHIPIAQ